MSSYLCLKLFLWDGVDTPRSATDFVDYYKFSMCKLILLMIAFSISTCVFGHKDYYLRKYCCTKNDFNFLSNEHIMDVIFHETTLILKFLASCICVQHRYNCTKLRQIPVIPSPRTNLKKSNLILPGKLCCYLVQLYDNRNTFQPLRYFLCTTQTRLVFDVLGQ